MEYKEFEKLVLRVLDKTLICVLVTADKNGVLTADQMCLVSDGLKVYIQTDKTFEKVKNIRQNPHVAINCGAYCFKGLAKIVGHPTKNPAFVEKIKQKHPETYEQYTNLPNEVLIEIELTEGKAWGVGKVEGDKRSAMTICDFVKKTAKTILCDKN